MRAGWLKPRCGIGVKMFGVIYAKPISGVRPSLDRSGKVSALLSLEGMKRSLRVLLRALSENNIDMFRLRRPNAEVCFICADQFRSDRIAAKCSGIAGPRLSPVTGVTVIGFDGFSFSVQHRSPRTCGALAQEATDRAVRAPTWA